MYFYVLFYFQHCCHSVSTVLEDVHFPLLVEEKSTNYLNQHVLKLRFSGFFLIIYRSSHISWRFLVIRARTLSVWVWFSLMLLLLSHLSLSILFIHFSVYYVLFIPLSLYRRTFRSTQMSAPSVIRYRTFHLVIFSDICYQLHFHLIIFCGRLNRPFT